MTAQPRQTLSTQPNPRAPSLTELDQREDRRAILHASSERGMLALAILVQWPSCQAHY